MWEGWIPLLPVHKPPLALSSLCSPPLAADTSIINLGVWRRVRGRHRKHASLPYLTHPSAENTPAIKSKAQRWDGLRRTAHLHQCVETTQSQKITSYEPLQKNTFSYCNFQMTTPTAVLSSSWLLTSIWRSVWCTSQIVLDKRTLSKKENADYQLKWSATACSDYTKFSTS